MVKLKCSKITKIHRRYPDQKWDYKALFCRTDKKGKPTDIGFYKLKDKGKSSQGVEIYSGKNYIVGSEAPSYSRRYDINKVPNEIKSLINELKSKHTKTKWSKKKRVDFN